MEFIPSSTDNIGAAVNSTTVSVTVDVADATITVSVYPYSYCCWCRLHFYSYGHKGPFSTTLQVIQELIRLAFKCGKAISPSEYWKLYNGVWTVSRNFDWCWFSVDYGTTAGSGMSGTSGSFAVNPGVFDHFVFSSSVLRLLALLSA